MAYVWSKMSKDVTVTFPVSTLPKDEDFYQFQYLKGDNQVAGASVPFQLRSPGRGQSQEICGVREEDDLLVVQTPQTSLQDKYSSLLDLSEKLTDELNKKNESFIVLEQRHQSLLDNNLRLQQMEDDLKQLVGDKVQLEETLTQTSETLSKTESVLSASTHQLKEVEKALELKIAQVVGLQQDLEKSDSKCGALTSDVGHLREERDKLAAMLEVEIKSRELLMTEKQELVDRLEDVSNMLNAAAKSKDLAVGEIRTQIQQQDKLRQEIANIKQEKGNLEAELYSVKQQLALFTENEEDNYVVKTVLSSMGEKLEARERELKQKNEEISLLKQLEASKESLVIHEKCLEDADSRATMLEKQNKELMKQNEELNVKIEKIESENKELKARLDSGATHYKKLAAEKNALMKERKIEGKSDEVYLAKIASLERKIQELSRQEDTGRSQELHLSEVSRAVSSREGEGSSVGSLDSVSTSSNTAMDSIQIQEAVQTLRPPQFPQLPPRVPRVPMPSAFQPSLFQPFPPAPGVEHQPSLQTTGVLPRPLQPENVGPTSLASVTSGTSIPELTPRAPAPYSFSQPSLVSHCPICQVEFGNENLEEVQRHVNRHMDESCRECPVCSEKFELTVPQDQYEAHVQEHFQDQVRGPGT